MSTTNFMGLTMAVFTGFGWAGEETALKFAFDQLESFINALHVSLPRNIQQDLPAFGLSNESQGVYLAANSDVERDAHIAFYARPMSLEMQLAITDTAVLAKGLAAAEKAPANCHHLITQLGPEWSVRIQQMLVEEESGAISHYSDLFKDSMAEFTLEKAEELIAKAAYLNGQEKWVTPIYLSRRFNAEQIAAMGFKVVDVMGEQVARAMPLLALLSGRAGRKATRTSKRKPKAKAPAAETPAPVTKTVEPELAPEEGFVYVSELKPLHLRRGFVNMTSNHWPFFAINARTETRDVSVYYEGVYDKKSAVWRLQPGDVARLVLGPAAHEWLEDNFAPDDHIQLRAVKLDNDEIQISLTEIE